MSETAEHAALAAATASDDTPLLEPGTPIQLQFAGVRERAASRVVGMEPGRYIIVRAPSMAHLGGISARLKPGSQMVVRCVHAGIAVGFATTVIERIGQPAPLLFLECPMLIARQTLRATPRVDCALPSSLQWNGEAHEAIVVDIGSQGCRIRLKATGASGDGAVDAAGREVRLSISLPGREADLLLSAVVHNVARDGLGIELGLRFGDLDESARRNIEEFVSAVR